MTANMQFEVDTRNDVLLVPNAALGWTPETSPIDPSTGAIAPLTDDASSAEELGRVWVTTDGRSVRPVDVTIGESDGTLTEISGPEVLEGMQVVLGEQGGNGEPAEDGETSTNPFLPKPPKGSRPPPPM